MESFLDNIIYNSYLCSNNSLLLKNVVSEVINPDSVQVKFLSSKLLMSLQMSLLFTTVSSLCMRVLEKIK